ncbi:universal stress protein [Streptacidiphilus sp. PAMC 29251]
MKRPVVAGVDGSPQSLAAARWAAREAVLLGSPLRLLYAWPWLPHLYPGSPSPDALQADALRMLTGAGADIQADFPDLAVDTEMLSYSTVDGLLAAGDDVELMVLGSRGTGGFRNLLVGSTSLAAAARSTCPVVLVPDGESPEGAVASRREVVLGLDARHSSDALIDFALRTATSSGSSLRVVHAWSPPPLWSVNPVDPGVPERDRMHRESRLLAEALHGWAEKYPGTRIHAEARPGTAAAVLVDEATKAGMLIVGRQVTRPVLGMRLGPVAHAVLHHAMCPVAVVPHD